MKSNLSAFLDDELEHRLQRTVLAALTRDEALCRAWDRYHLIGDALRRSPALDRRLTPCIMERLEREPALLAPRLRRGEHPVRSALAVAATAAGVALVAWVALGPAPAPPVPALAQAPVATTPGAQSSARSSHVPSASSRGTAASNRLQEYMVAHQTYSPANRILGGTAYVRTVSAAAGGGSEDRAR